MADGTGKAPVRRVPWNRRDGHGRQPYALHTVCVDRLRGVKAARIHRLCRLMRRLSETDSELNRTSIDLDGFEQQPNNNHGEMGMASLRRQRVYQSDLHSHPFMGSQVLTVTITPAETSSSDQMRILPENIELWVCLDLQFRSVGGGGAIPVLRECVELWAGPSLQFRRVDISVADGDQRGRTLKSTIPDMNPFEPGVDSVVELG
ncbi:hypothetical protein DFH08DRAFT_821517 [Mycena albidolilacea]|uniref:Uncharacterized protein n=1 Tax=Mycena albidolilacea TaxID=1033008 RepID=A0AAD7EDB4_9AGAR|nr:hypothetical protein DFH08DRAFT_821517 [Mycena albidolilacea]